MYQSLEVFQLAADMARHAGSRQAVTARNIANADTPGFTAQAIPPFRDVYSADPALKMRATRPEHLENADGSRTAALILAGDAEPSPNGNAVSIEAEMLNAVEISREHNRALAIYRHAMTVLRTSLGR